MFRIKLNNPLEEFCLGAYCHKIQKITVDEEDENNTTTEDCHRLVIGFLVISIDIIW